MYLFFIREEIWRSYRIMSIETHISSQRVAEHGGFFFLRIHFHILWASREIVFEYVWNKIKNFKWMNRTQYFLLMNLRFFFIFSDTSSNFNIFIWIWRIRFPSSMDEKKKHYNLNAFFFWNLPQICTVSFYLIFNFCDSWNSIKKVVW